MRKKIINTIVAIATVVLGVITVVSFFNDSVIFCYTIIPFSIGTAYLAYLWDKKIVKWCNRKGLKEEPLLD